MDLDNQLKNLNELPVDQQMKKEMYGRITKRSNQFAVWKEVVLLGAIAAIALFLLILPSITPTYQQANSQSVEAIYAYEKGKDGKFFARPSTLYLGVEIIENPQLFEFFEHYQDYVKASTGKFDPALPIDVVVIRDGKEERWKMEWSGILNVNTGEFYKAINRDDYGDMVAETFYSSTGETDFIIFFLLPAALITSLFPTILYGWRKKDEKSPLYNNIKFGFFSFAPYMMILGWQFFIGPLYKPLLVIFTILFLLITQIFLKRYKTTAFVYRVEMIRYSILTLLLITLIFSY